MFCTLFGELGTRFVSRAFATAHRSVLPRNMYSCSAPCSGNLGHALFHERSRISKHCFSIQIPKQVRNDKFKIIFPHRYFKTSFHKQSQTQNAKRYATAPPGTEGAPHVHRRTLATAKPNLEPETVCNCPRARKVRPTRTGARLLQPSRTQNSKRYATAPPGTEGAPHAHRRTLAPTKPNLELETVCKRARPCYNLLDSITIRYKFFYLIKK